MNSIVVTSPMDLSGAQRTRLEGFGLPVIFHDTEPADVAEWLERCRGHEFVCSGKSGMTWPLSPSGPDDDYAIYHLTPGTFVAHPFVNVSMINQDRLRHNEVRLGYAPGCNKLGVTGWIVWGLLRHFQDIERFVNIGRNPGDEERAKKFGRMRGIADLKVTILGPGQVGSATAHVLHALGAEVLFFGRNNGARHEGFLVRSDLHGSVLDADVVINCLSSKPENSKLLDGEFFLAMKEKALFVSVANPAIWSMDALLSMTDTGRLFAWIDIGNKGPADVTASTYQHMLGEENVLVTPQIAHFTENSARVSFDMMIDNIEAAVSSKPIPHIWA